MPASPKPLLLAGNRVLLQLGAITAILIGAVILADVIGRAAFNRPLAGAVEIAQNGVVLAVFLCFPHAVQQEDILSIGSFLEGRSERIQQAVRIAGLVLGAVFMGGLVVTNWPATLDAFRNREFDGYGGLRVPMGPIRAFVLALWAWTLLNLLWLLAECATKRSRAGD